MHAPCPTPALDLRHQRRLGYWLGAVAVLLFALNFAAMKIALRDLDPTIVGLGRGLLAAIPAAILLLWTRQPFPKRRHALPLTLTTLGAVLGFPMFLAIALRDVHATHAAVVSGLIPLATAILGSWREGEKQPPLFWIAALVGSGVVVGYAFITGGNALSMADLALFAAVLSAAVGYTEGAGLAKEIGSWQVICWALVFSVPALVFPVYKSYQANGFHASPEAWAGFLYAGLISMFLGYFIWYRGLALGGVARVSQLQLLQPFIALISCALLLKETLTLPTLLCGLLAFACVLVTRFAGAARHSSLCPVDPKAKTP